MNRAQSVIESVHRIYEAAEVVFRVSPYGPIAKVVVASKCSTGFQ